MRPLQQYLADGAASEYSDEEGDENYKTMSSASAAKGLPKFHNTSQPTAFIQDRHSYNNHHSNYDVPRNLSQPILEQEDEATNNSNQNINISKDMI